MCCGRLTLIFNEEAMDIHPLKRMNDYCWVYSGNKSNHNAPIHLYGSYQIIKNLDDKVFEQISNVAKLPGLVGPAMTMPDAHWGYGFPIGGVAAFDEEAGGIISAGGVGFDISCGVRCLRTNLTWEDLYQHSEALSDLLFLQIPAGLGVEGRLKLTPKELDSVLCGGARWAVSEGFGKDEDLKFIEEHGQMSNAMPQNVSLLAKERQAGEMGTLGSGNHYLEIQEVAKIYDATAASAFGLQLGQIIISIHCGSRGLGHQIGTDYLITLAKAAHRLGIDLPDRELACAPIASKEGKQYIGAMYAGINCALANRQILTHLTREVFDKILPGTRIDTLYDVSHNTCKRERHQIDGKERWLYVHRKGATRALGPKHELLPEEYKTVGQPVVIGGSMGTGSYILAGNSEIENKAFASASHGAGRAMSRRQAIRHWRGKQIIEELKIKGIIIRSRSMRGVAEEAPDAYKDVDEVAISTEKAGLAHRVALLRPKICVKG